MEKGITYIVIVLILCGTFFMFLTNASQFGSGRMPDFAPFYKRDVRQEAQAQDGATERSLENIKEQNILIAGYTTRITKKPFGISVSPQNSPVTPERFSGYHTGVDFEVTEEELEKEIPVCAMCDGEIVVARRVGGYGGVLVQRCDLNAHGAVTVLYGHLALDGLQTMQGKVITKGERIGILGRGFSADTDGERKHLHLSIHKGTGITYAGYVDTESKLSQWIDPCTVITCATQK